MNGRKGEKKRNTNAHKYIHALTHSLTRTPEYMYRSFYKLVLCYHFLLALFFFFFLPSSIVTVFFFGVTAVVRCRCWLC